MSKVKHMASYLALLLYLVIFIFAAYFAWSNYQENRKQKVIQEKSKLSLEVNIKKALLEKFYETIETEILFWSQTGSLRLGLDTLKTTWSELGQPSKKLQKIYVVDNPFKIKAKLYNAKDGSNYSLLHHALHEFLYELQEKRKYSDILLLDMDGNILYSVQKNKNFAKNISKNRNNLQEVFSEIKSTDKKDFVSFRDFKKDDGGFLATAVSDERGDKMGVLVFELSSKEIEKIAHLETVNKDLCEGRFEETKDEFTAYECVKFKDNYWGIKASEKSEQIYKPIFDEFIKQLIIYLTIALVSVLLSYIILERMLGKKEEDDE